MCGQELVYRKRKYPSTEGAWPAAETESQAPGGFYGPGELEEDSFLPLGLTIDARKGYRYLQIALPSLSQLIFSL